MMMTCSSRTSSPGKAIAEWMTEETLTVSGVGRGAGASIGATENATFSGAFALARCAGTTSATRKEQPLRANARKRSADRIQQDY